MTKSSVKAKIITIGDEILIGQIVDTNSAWMGEQLNAIGIDVVEILTIKDDRNAILEALNTIHDFDVVLITGGLGPTTDDITKPTLCTYFDTKLVYHSAVFEKIKKAFDQRNIPISESNKLQAYLPQNCEVIPNSCGTASGMWWKQKETIVVAMPGVPYEMKAIMTEELLPKFKTIFNTQPIIHHTVLTIGMGESSLAEKVADWQKGIENKGIKLAFLPVSPIVKLRLSAKGELASAVQAGLAELKQLIPDLIIGYNTDKLEQTVGELLVQNNKTIALAESCTGGKISSLLTEIPGSSAYLKGAVVAYANEVKVAILGVDVADIELYGAVSEQVVIQMAKGVQQKMNTDYAIATSGIAGPDGGTKDKPVGTIWIAISTPRGMITKKLQLGKDRVRNINSTAIIALNMLRKQLL